MYWRLSAVTTGGEELPSHVDGRFVLHRHCDAEGAHLDLRLEAGDCCVGWRVEDTALGGAAWAREKAPHPLHWLEQDGDAVREDAGTYAWLERDAEGGRLVLRGRGGERVLRVTRGPALPAAAVHAVLEAVRDAKAAPEAVAGLLRDGVTARRRAVARFCGLGRELDGDAFDEGVWRTTLEGLSLEEVHRHLSAYELRFDRKYPPAPVSRPERLDGADGDGGHTRAMAILAGSGIGDPGSGGAGV